MKDWKKHILPVAAGATVIGIGTAVITSASGLENLFEPDQFRHFENRYHEDEYQYVAGDGEKTDLADQDKDSQGESGSDKESSIPAIEEQEPQKPGSSDIADLRLAEETSLPDTYERNSGYEIADRENSTLPDIFLPESGTSEGEKEQNGSTSTPVEADDSASRDIAGEGTTTDNTTPGAGEDSSTDGNVIPTPDTTKKSDVTTTSDGTTKPTPVPTPTPDDSSDEERKPTQWEADQLKPKDQPTLPDGTVLTGLTAEFNEGNAYFSVFEEFDPDRATVTLYYEDKAGNASSRILSYGGDDGYSVSFNTKLPGTSSAVFSYKGLSARAGYTVYGNFVKLYYEAIYTDGSYYMAEFPGTDLKNLISEDAYQALVARYTKFPYTYVQKGNKVDLTGLSHLMIAYLGNEKVEQVFKSSAKSNYPYMQYITSVDEEGYLEYMLEGFRCIAGKKVQDEKSYLYYPLDIRNNVSKNIANYLVKVPDGYKIRRITEGEEDGEVNWTAYRGDQVLEKYTGTGDVITVPMGTTLIDLKEEAAGVTTLALPQSIQQIDAENIGTHLPDLQNYRYADTEKDMEYKGYRIIDGVLYSEDGNTLLSVPAGRTSFEVPEHVTALGTACFAGMKDTSAIVFKGAVPPENLAETELPGTIYVSGSEQDTVLKQYMFALGDTSQTVRIRISDEAEEPENENRYTWKADADGNAYLCRTADDGILEAVSPSVSGSWKVPDAVTTVGSRAFYGCTAVSDIEIEHNEVHLSEGSLQDLKAGQSLTIKGTGVTVAPKAFGDPADGVPDITVYVPEGQYDAYLSSWSKSLDPVYGDGTAQKLLRAATGRYVYEDGAKYQELSGADGKAYRLLSVYQTGKVVFTVKEGTEEIAAGALDNLDKLEILYLPDSLKAFSAEELQGLPALETVAANNQNLQTEVPADAGWELLQAGGEYEKLLLEDNAILYGQTKDGYTLINAATSCSKTPAIKEQTMQLRKNAFRDCTNIRAIEFPAALTDIGDACFYGCTALQKADLSDCKILTSIGDGAFRSCTGLQQVRLPESLTTLPDEMFYDCDALELIAADAVTEIGEDTFYNCMSLNATGNLFRHLLAVGKEAFANCKSLTAVVLPETLVSMDESCFENCTSLKTVELDGQLTAISRYCFYGCDQLSEVLFGDTQKEALLVVGAQAFGSCSNLQKIDLSGLTQLRYLGAELFENCSSLETVTFPESTTELPDQCFEACDKLSLVQLSASSGITFGKQVFGKTLPDNLLITIPEENMKANFEMYQEALDSQYGADTAKNRIGVTSDTMRVLQGITYERAEDGWVLTKADPSYEGTFKVLDDTVRIAEDAFSGCTGLTALYIPQKVTVKLGARCFKGCTGLTEIHITGNVPEWEEETFMDCTLLGTVNIGSDESDIPRIGTRAFKNCTGLNSDDSVWLGGKVLAFGTECFSGCSNLPGINYSTLEITCLERVEDSAFEDCVTLRASFTSKFTGLTSIGKYVFRNCDSLKSPSVPANVTSIGEGCFMDCDNLKTVSIYGAVEEYPKDCFKNCPKLERTGGTPAAFAALKRIGEGAYEDCTSLTASSSWYLGRYANLEEIGDHAFRSSGYGGTAVTTALLPASLTKLGECVFDHCTSLHKLTFQSTTPPVIGAMDLSAMAEDFAILVPDSQDSDDSIYKAYLEILSGVLGEDNAKDILDSLTDGAKERSETGETPETENPDTENPDTENADTENSDAAEEQVTEDGAAAGILPEIPVNAAEDSEPSGQETPENSGDSGESGEGQETAASPEQEGQEELPEELPEETPEEAVSSGEQREAAEVPESSENHTEENTP